MAWVPIFSFSSPSTGTSGGGASPVGMRGQDGSTWLSGEGEPEALAGLVGDFYLQTDTGQVWKKEGADLFVPAWNSLLNLTGPAGEQGEAGERGPQGITGPSGQTGETGATGATGAPGAAGAAGADGAAGANAVGMRGPQGEPGSQIFTGDATPSGSLGRINDLYFKTNGDLFQKVVPHEFGLPYWKEVSNLVGPAGSKGATGAAGSQVVVADGRRNNPSDVPGLFTGFISGLPLKWVSTSSISVGPGFARDGGDTGFITLPSTKTISTGTLGAINGIDRKQLTGTVATDTASAEVTGTGTLFLTEFGTRAATGTISGGLTTITGSGTKFLEEVAVGDLIGNSSKGYALITAISSNTSLMLGTAIPGGDPSGGTFNVIENAIFQAGSQTPQQVLRINSNTLLAIASLSSATQSGVAAYAGALSNAALGALLDTTYYYAWLAYGDSGTGVFLSTQRTKPFGVTGYLGMFRRIGVVAWSILASVIVAFNQWGKSNERNYNLDAQNNLYGVNILTGGSSTSWVRTDTNEVAPPTAVTVNLTLSILGPSAAMIAYVRSSGTGESATSRPMHIASAKSTTSYVFSNVSCPCDGAQAIDYVVSAGNVFDIHVCGYEEYV